MTDLQRRLDVTQPPRTGARPAAPSHPVATIDPADSWLIGFEVRMGAEDLTTWVYYVVARAPSASQAMTIAGRRLAADDESPFRSPHGTAVERTTVQVIHDNGIGQRELLNAG